MSQVAEALVTEDNPPVVEQGDFSQFYYALLDKQEEEGYSDLVIHVAYGIYKTEKQKEIERLRVELGHAPERCELNHFVTIAISHIDYYITEAGKEQAAFAKFVIDSLEVQQDKKILDVAKSITPQSGWQAVWYGFVGNLIWTVVIALLAWFGTFGGKIQSIFK